MPPKGYVFNSLEERFWAKVQPEPSGCWRWIAYTGGVGYGYIKEGGRGSRLLVAHRYAYELLAGPIPAGHELDHLCRHRWCVNPQHLEAVSHTENIRRGVAPNILISQSGKCAQGHEINATNTYYRKDRPGRWNCRICRQERRHRERLPSAS